MGRSGVPRPCPALGPAHEQSSGRRREKAMMTHLGATGDRGFQPPLDASSGLLGRFMAASIACLGRVPRLNASFGVFHQDQRSVGSMPHQGPPCRTIILAGPHLRPPTFGPEPLINYQLPQLSTASGLTPPSPLPIISQVMSISRQVTKMLSGLEWLAVWDCGKAWVSWTTLSLHQLRQRGNRPHGSGQKVGSFRFVFVPMTLSQTYC